MDKFQCDRCGKCCFVFNQRERPIRFLPDEPIITMSFLAIHKLKNPRLDIFHRVKEDFKQIIGGKTYFVVPTSAEIQPFLREEEKDLIPYASDCASDCMFLQRFDSPQADEESTSCQIHSTNPKMCRDYPSSKGNVCLNQPERKYTREFYTYQHTKIGFAIAPLRSLFSSLFNQPFAAEILTILMDFGTFSAEHLREFFSAEFHVDPHTFDSTIQELALQSLVTIISGTITGISLREVEKLIDQLMQERGWQIPPIPSNRDK